MTRWTYLNTHRVPAHMCVYLYLSIFINMCVYTYRIVQKSWKISASRNPAFFPGTLGVCKQMFSTEGSTQGCQVILSDYQHCPGLAQIHQQDSGLAGGASHGVKDK